MNSVVSLRLMVFRLFSTADRVFILCLYFLLGMISKMNQNSIEKMLYHLSSVWVNNLPRMAEKEGKNLKSWWHHLATVLRLESASYWLRWQMFILFYLLYCIFWGCSQNKRNAANIYLKRLKMHYRKWKCTIKKISNLMKYDK